MLHRLSFRFIGLLLVFCLAGPLLAQSLRNPKRISEGPPGQILVSDRYLDSVLSLDEETLLPVWTLPIEGSPFGVAQWRNRLFIGNTATANVEVYRVSKDGARVKFLFNLGHTISGQPGYIQKPTDIAFHRRSRQVYVLDSGDKKIKIYNLRGRFLSEFPVIDGQGRILAPVAFTVDEVRGEVLVSDYGDPAGFFSISVPARILIYDLTGNYLGQINGDGSTHPETKFLRPQGLVTDGMGRIFLAAALTGHILVLERATGVLLRKVGEPGSEPGELRLPVDVVLSPESGDLFVTNNMGARKIEVFRGVGRLP
jgi:DNA-binding beta-propeller fold protein YncE